MQKIYVKPKDYWMNDPNGFIYYKGMYHLFYQCFPYAPRWGRMHWGHVVSKDLVNWEEQGIALFPSKTDDRSGCFSGSAIEEDGKMQLYYTGVNYLTEYPEDINLCVDEHFVSAQLKITSEDGLHFDNIKDKKTVRDGTWYLEAPLKTNRENFCSLQVQMEKNGNLKIL